AQYILEEDDENVELMDIEFGFEGMPFYIKGPNDDDAKIQSIKNTLMRTVGEGNFLVIENPEDLDDDEFDEDDWYMDDEDDEDDDGLPEEQREVLEEVLRVMKPTKKVYDKAIRTDEGREMLKKSTIGKGYRLAKKPVQTAYDTFKDAAEESFYAELRELFDNSEFKEAIARLKEAITVRAGNAMFYNLLQACYIFDGQYDESNKLIIEMYKRFPDYIFATVPYANMLIDKNKTAQAIAVFNGKADLDELYPGQKQFNRHEAAIYYAVMCRYFVAIGDIDSADLYMNAIFKKDLQYMPHQTLVNKALMDLCNAKIKKIKVKIGF
ncbi:MAG: tetratricopeptide repeat protein, partial [Sphingobacteriales bacterium]